VVNFTTMTSARFDAPLFAAAAADGANKLPPSAKTAVQLALVVIGLVGVLLIAMTLLGGHWVRRQGSPRRGPVVPPDREPILQNSPRRRDEHDDPEN
jgi:hypothetical protein